MPGDLYGDDRYGDDNYAGEDDVIIVPDIIDSSVMLDLDGVRFALDDPDNGFVVTGVDTGSPTAREVTANRVNADGTTDQTEFVGGRNVLVNLTLCGEDRQAQLDMLARYLSQRVRPRLLIKTERAHTHYRLLTVRHTSDMSMPWQRPGILDTTIGFRSVGSPYWQHEHETVMTAYPDTAVTTSGATFDWSFDLVFPGDPGSGPASVINQGNRPAKWIARIFGPVTGPRLIHANSGLEIHFQTSLVIAPGDFLEINSENHTVRVNGDPAASRYSHINFAETDWWDLDPGLNTIRLTGSPIASPAQAELVWRHSFL